MSRIMAISDVAEDSGRPVRRRTPSSSTRRTFGPARQFLEGVVVEMADRTAAQPLGGCVERDGATVGRDGVGAGEVQTVGGAAGQVRVIGAVPLGSCMTATLSLVTRN